MADLITTCYGGRNRKVSEVSRNTSDNFYNSNTVMLAQAFVVRKKSIVELESDMLNGQKLQGPETAAEVNHLLASKGLEAEFPLFTAVHKVSHRQFSFQRFSLLTLFIQQPWSGVHGSPGAHRADRGHQEPPRPRVEQLQGGHGAAVEH